MGSNERARRPHRTMLHAMIHDFISDDMRTQSNCSSGHFKQRLMSRHNVFSFCFFGGASLRRNVERTQ